MTIAPLRLGSSCFVWGRRTYVMGIINVTPDSFAGDGTVDVGAAVARAHQMVEDGADIVDIGGESTRPGAGQVATETEMDRVLPVVQRLAGHLPVPISVDTSKPEIASAALRAGATIINDVHGLRRDRAMAGVIAEHGAGVVVMANLRGETYSDVIDAVCTQLVASVRLATDAGVPPERVMVDPGFGFGPLPEENLEIVRQIGRFRELGHPVLLGPSRKSTIGKVLDLPVDQRFEGTAALVAAAIERGVDVVRVHDVRGIVRLARMADAVARGWSPAHVSEQVLA
jgi:dihydropteroate synthase